MNKMSSNSSKILGTDPFMLARTDTNGSTFYHADGNGNITALMDTNENIVARYLYNPFGKLLGQWGTNAVANTMQFSSMPQHDGLTLYPFRAYDPNFQRWLNQDPIQEWGGINLYRFVGNNPINRVDRFGLDFSTWIGAGAGYNNFTGGSLGKGPVTPMEGEFQFSVGISGTAGIMSELTGMPQGYGFVSSSDSIGFTTKGTIFYQHTSSALDGFGLFGAEGFSAQVAYSKCPLKSGKTISHGTHGEGGFGEFLEGELSFDADDEGVGLDVPLPDKLKAELGGGGGVITAAGPSTTTTFAEQPGSSTAPPAYQSSPAYQYGF